MTDKEGRKRFLKAAKMASDASSFLLSHAEMASRVTEKADNDFVTEADRTVESLISESIREDFPYDGIYGEEGGGDSSGVRWIIDPIDGTVNFMNSFPGYTVSIGFEDDEGPLFGVVSVPATGEVFTAYRGTGAYLNDSRIRTSERDDLSKTLALLVPPHRSKEYLDEYMAKMKKFYYVVSDARSVGSAALSICTVASGRASMYYEMMLHYYDVAAALVILSEAGGRFSLIPMGGGYFNIAASSSSGFDMMMSIVND